MSKIAASPRADNAGASLPLLDYAERTRIRSLPMPARRLARRHNLPPATACMIAEAAGFALEARQ